MSTIYLIDDDSIFVYLLAKIIETIDSSATVQVFGDGEAALDYITGNREDAALMPDFIFLDLNMPVMDGWEFLEQYGAIYREGSKEVFLYILSSTISAADIERMGKYPVIREFLVKPPEKSAIAEIILKKNSGQ